MPSEKILEQKKQIVAELAEKLQKACAGVIVDYKGINVADDTKLRKELREAGVEYAVVKTVLEGTTALALSNDDYVAAARILCNFAKDHENFKIKIGFTDDQILDAASVEALSKLPSREELVAKALGGLNAPIAGFVHVLNANLRGLVCALNAIAEKQGA